MIKKAILLSALAGACTVANAQSVHKCGTDEFHREMISKYPQVKVADEALEKIFRNSLSRTTGAGDYMKYVDSLYNAEIAEKLIIPVVVHVIHDYGVEYVSDNDIFDMINKMNIIYQKKNDQSATIEPFKKYIGLMNIEFRLARKDPNGQPTTGITRHFSYLTNGGDEYAKFDQWAPDRYLNVWIENRIGRGVANGTILAYSNFPSSAAANPFGDGIITRYNSIGDASNTMSHEVGHYFNLAHPWNSSGAEVGQACGDDGVDDTPPTKGHFGGCPLFDSACANGYQIIYSPGDTVNYPDTTNVQNFMDYSDCPNMFTKQQVIRARIALRSSVGNRNGLISPNGQVATGVLNPANDLPPVADFSVERSGGERTVYLCADNDKEFIFRNRSWRDTATVSWEFGNGATPATSTNATQNVLVKVTQPGWVNVKLTATGNNSGSTTLEAQRAYAADPNYKIKPMDGYFQEFNESGDRDKWPSFNYYNNQTKWELTNVGYYDNSGIRFTGFDSRVYPGNTTGSFELDYDDFFTPIFDLSGMTNGDCNLNFMSAGVFNTTNTDEMDDVLQIHYSTNCGETWVKMDSVAKADLANNGTYTMPFQPQWMGEWKLQSRNIPAQARTGNTMFRFRYKPTVDTRSQGYMAVGNNFYMDRINVSPFPLGVNTLVDGDKTIAVAPNPTSENAFVIIKGNEGKDASIVVADVTGKVVYRTKQALTESISRIEIPASAIAVKGMYMIQVATGDQVQTEKLIAR
jgi:Pregnancy-associated plasma protein-A.